MTETSAAFAIDDDGKVEIEDRAPAVVGGIIETVTPKNARSGQAMAFLTLEDLVGTLEVIVFPKDYAIYRPLIFAGNKVLIRGRASVGTEEEGKLIAEKILGFDQLEREVWIRFKDLGEYRLQEAYLMDLSGFEGMAGNTKLAIFLADTRQIKYMPPECSINGNEEVLRMLKARFGENNVEVNVRKI